MTSATPQSYSLDMQFNRENDDFYASGPLHNMKKYCPQDLDGGGLSEWTVESFFPVWIDVGWFIPGCICMQVAGNYVYLHA